jgi:hypothetical protein
MGTRSLDKKAHVLLPLKREKGKRTDQCGNPDKDALYYFKHNKKQAAIVNQSQSVY